MSIAISGASGNLGRRTAELLLEQVDSSQVVLLTRTPSKLDDLAARGATVRASDFADPAGVEAALAGVEKLLIVSTDTIGDRVEQQKAAIAAAKAAGVRHVVYTSAPQPSADSPSVVVREHHATEEAARASGLAYTFLRNNLYSEFQIAAGVGAVAGGAVYSNKGGRGVAYVTREDCAAAAAAVLAGGAEHENVTYEITGAEAISDERLAELYAQVAEQPIGVVEVDDAALTAGMIAGGVPEFMAPILVGFGEAARLGKLELVSTAVADLTGKAPTSLASVLMDAKEALLGPASAAR